MYEIPALFRNRCKLRVPFAMRPRATDGVFLMGARRSGSFPHVDPRSTSAWNWLLHGTKRWRLVPPTAAWGDDDGGGGCDCTQRAGELLVIPEVGACVCGRADDNGRGRRVGASCL